MPPPTSPSHNSPNYLGLPGFFEGLNNLRLRHLVSRDFLTRMNEVLANLLNQYTASSVHADPNDDELISTTLLPAQIRNLASPIRFLAIPDLDLDMDLDATDTDSRSYADDSLGSSLDSDSDAYQLDEISDSESTSDSDVPLHGLLDRIQLAQRLLLSSALQNHTNRNTLIITPETRASAIPLRRQNAIRSKSRGDHNAQALESVAKEYHNDFVETIAAIRALLTYSGKSPLFSGHPHEQRRGLRRWGCRRLKRPSLQAQMDRFLHLRRRSRLWAEERHFPRAEATSSDLKRKTGPDCTHSDSSNGQKRRKLRAEKRRSVITATAEGEHINPSQLLRADKYRILGGLRCLFLRSGSTFALGLVSDWLFKRGSDVLDLTFSNVDHSEKALHGYFTLKFGGDRTGDVHLILSFLSFLCGGPRSGYATNCTNRVIQTKAALLNEAFMAAIVEHGLSSPAVISCLTKTYQIPFLGEIVDFNKNDLRFMPDSRQSSSKLSFLRAMHISRVRNEQIKLQLGEWLRIRPFHNFAESFFLNYLHFVEKYLRDFDLSPKHEQELTIDFAKHFKEQMLDIAKDFGFDGIPILADKLEQLQRDLCDRRRHEPRASLHKTPFLQEWDSKLGEKLCDYVTCEDTCLLNIQLNYVLFTVRVDVLAALDQVFTRFLELVTPMERRLLQKKYDAVGSEPLLTESRETVFVCLINRKTGRLEMQNTRLLLDYKYAGSCDARGALFPTPLDAYSDSEDDGPSRLYGVPHASYLEDPYLMGNPTVMTGAWKRSLGGRTCTGGHAWSHFV